MGILISSQVANCNSQYNDLNMRYLTQYKNTGNIEIRNKIIEVNIPLVKSIVIKSPLLKLKEFEFEDLFCFGIFGLIKAIDAFDLSKNVRFSTFAYWKIYYSIIDEVRKLDWLPRHTRDKLDLIKNDIESTIKVFGYSPSISEIASAYNLSCFEKSLLLPDKIISLDSLMQCIGVDGAENLIIKKRIR